MTTERTLIVLALVALWWLLAGLVGRWLAWQPLLTLLCAGWLALVEALCVWRIWQQQQRRARLGARRR